MKREYSFDILRVISMIMVIIVHVSNVYSRSFGFISNSSFIFSLIFNTISRISVPIFLMISGALLLDRKFDFKKYKKRIIKFLILIIVWDIIYLVWEYYYLHISYDKLYNLLFNPYRAHLWFLYTILLLYLIQPILRKILIKSNIQVKVLLLTLWILFSTGSMIFKPLAQYFTFFSYMGFFIIGKYLYNYIKKNDLSKYNMFYNLYFAYRTPFIILSSFAFYTLIITNYKKDSLNKIIQKLSDLSLGVYLIHGIFLDITIKTFVYQSINSLIGIPIFTILIFIASVISTYILSKIKYIKTIIQ